MNHVAFISALSQPAGAMAVGARRCGEKPADVEFSQIVVSSSSNLKEERSKESKAFQGTLIHLLVYHKTSRKTAKRKEKFDPYLVFV